MAEISYFWNGTTGGDSVAAPYEAASLFSAVMSTLSRGINYPNQGYVLDSANAGNRLAVTYIAVGGVRIDTGTAVVIGTWYNNGGVITIPIPHYPPASSTRIDRVVLRKDWAAHTVRIVYLEGSPTTGGGAEPALSTAYGTTWDIPLAKISTTTGGVVTVTDERVLSASGQAKSSVFIPSDPNAYPQTHYNADPTSGGSYVALTGLPANATAAYVTFLKNTGTFNLFVIASGGSFSGASVYEITGNPSEIKPGPILVPIDTVNGPGQIILANSGGVIDVFFFLVGYYIPF